MVEVEICQRWKVTDEEYQVLEKQFGRLCHDIAWKLLSKNSKGNHTDEQCDIYQEMRIKLLIAGAYQKRQMYIEKCLEVARKYVKDEFVKSVVDSLEDLWKNKKRHGANKQKFGAEQEELLTKIVMKYVPSKKRPKQDAPLQINDKFPTYCKSILQNRGHYLGKRITREKPLRTKMASLSEYDYLSGNL